MAARDQAKTPFCESDREDFLLRYIELLSRRGIVRVRRTIGAPRARQTGLFLRAVLSFPGAFSGDSGTDEDWHENDMASDAELTVSSDHWDIPDEASEALLDYGEEDEILNEGPGGSYHHFGSEDTVDADNFYAGGIRIRYLEGELAWAPFNDDDGYTYRTVQKNGNQRYGNRTRRATNEAPGDDASSVFPATSLGAYLHWEFHGKRAGEEKGGLDESSAQTGENLAEMGHGSAEKGQTLSEMCSLEENSTATSAELTSFNCSALSHSDPSFPASTSHDPASLELSDDEMALNSDSDASLSENSDTASETALPPENTLANDDFMAVEPEATSSETSPHPGPFSHNFAPEEYAFQTSASFPDALSLSYLGHTGLRFENMRKYKNNLSAVVSCENDYLVTAHNSDLLVYEFDGASQLPKPRTCLRIDTKPPYTLSEDRLVSTWPYFPHTINYVKTHENWLGCHALAACFDDGLVRIWYSKTITESIRKFGTTGPHTENSRLYGVKVSADFQFRLEASAWGVDMLVYEDCHGSSHHLIAVSDNSQRLTLLYYHEQDRTFYHITSHRVLHNVPSVSFAGFSVKDGLHSVEVTCASISGELLVFQTRFSLAEGPLAEKSPEPVYDTRESAPSAVHAFDRVQYTSLEVVSRTVLLEECWSATAVNSTFLKPVDSLGELVGDSLFEENREVAEIVAELELLGLELDPVKTSHMGLAAPLQFFQCKVCHSEKDDIHTSDDGSLGDDGHDSYKLVSVDDEYRRLHKLVQRLYSQFWQREPQLSLNGNLYRVNASDLVPEVYVCVSTQKRVGLFRADSLVCNCCSPPLFNTNMPFNEETQYANRISIAHVIPELLAFIAVTQQGLVLMLRLTQFRGVVGMRQEHVFPKAESVILTAGSTIRTIAGVTVRKGGPGRWWLYVIYTDGFTMGYTLRQESEE